uniref:AlNc14C1G159 protein n=1 Tax=Albugo laibachii Nc14 TaxID=890382 RepID=F0VZ13_9STRA|nr:AlNc14C1G159 [Albugo laibachii Nc14]|eukprot:CCA14028.1 AlNc14C1G159 [Albugo laibachii Nc14]
MTFNMGLITRRTFYLGGHKSGYIGPILSEFDICDCKFVPKNGQNQFEENRR